MPSVLKERLRWPIEQIQAQVDGARIQGINFPRNVDIESERFVGIEFVGTANQDCCQVGPDAPIAPLVGIGQGGASHRLTQSHPIEPVSYTHLTLPTNRE